MERRIRALKSDKSLHQIQKKERKFYQDASKHAQAKYKAYATKHGRDINLWRCSITKVERSAKGLTKTVENSKIKTKIDELTSCLRRTSDGSIVNTLIEEFDPTKNNTKNWEFDWVFEKNKIETFTP